MHKFFKWFYKWWFFEWTFQRQCFKKICTNFSKEKICTKDIFNDFQMFQNLCTKEHFQWFFQCLFKKYVQRFFEIYIFYVHSKEFFNDFIFV